MRTTARLQLYLRLNWITGILLLAFLSGCQPLAAAPGETVAPEPSTDPATDTPLVTPTAAFTKTPAATTSPLPTHTATLEGNMITILALGDSYTIGTNVSVEERWPVQLAAALREQGIPAADPLIIARNGWTTDDLETGIQAASPQGPFDLVTLLIGVNNQFRGYPLEAYRQEFAALLVQAIAFAGGDPGRVVVLSIPDWGVTPFATNRDRAQVAAEIDAFNAANREEAEKAGALYVDITPATRNMSQDNPHLLAADGLHPSGEMYVQWVQQVLPLVVPLLGE